MAARAPIAPAEVTLSVSDLERSLAFWTGPMGLRVRERENGSARLGVPERDLVVLEEQPGAHPRSDARTGLFHLALLVPERRDLAAWLAHAGAQGVRLTGASDHYVSEALYLRDPDGHGIEVYRDRPREGWNGPDGSLRMGSDPLDLRDLLSEQDPARPFEHMPDGTVMGHVHLRASWLDETTAFYRDVLGLDLMVAMPGQASFLSSGGYHHHVGMNVWGGVGVPPPPPDQAALKRAVLEVDGEAELERLEARLAGAGHEPVRDGGRVLVSDPSHNPLLLRAAA
jgi:catechol 2,3-dioxygenase